MCCGWSSCSSYHATWVHSSVVRAADCRSAGPWLKSGCALAQQVVAQRCGRDAASTQPLAQGCLEKGARPGYQGLELRWLVLHPVKLASCHLGT